MFIEPGRPERRTPDPTQNHYLLSEAAELQLRVLGEAMRAAAVLCEAFDAQAADPDPPAIGALFRVFADQAVQLAAETRFHASGRRAAA